MVAALPVNLPAAGTYPEAVKIFSCFWLQPIPDLLLVDGPEVAVTTATAAEGTHLTVQVKPGEDLLHL